MQAYSADSTGIAQQLETGAKRCIRLDPAALFLFCQGRYKFNKPGRGLVTVGMAYPNLPVR